MAIVPHAVGRTRKAETEGTGSAAQCCSRSCVVFPVLCVSSTAWVEPWLPVTLEGPRPPGRARKGLLCRFGSGP